MDGLRIIMIIMFIINSIFFGLNLLKELTSENFRLYLQNQRKKGEELADKAIKDIADTKELSGKVGKTIGISISFALFFLIVSAFIWVPTTLWVNSSFQLAMIAYLVFNIFFSFSRVFVLIYRRKEVVRFELRLSKIIMFMIFRYQLAFYIFFGFKSDLIDISTVFYNSSVLMNSTILISFAISYFFVAIFTPYVYIILVRYADKDKVVNNSILRFDVTLIICIASSFVALFFITDILSSTVNILSDISLTNTLDLVKIILSSILIPTIFNILNRSKSLSVNIE